MLRFYARQKEAEQEPFPTSDRRRKWPSRRRHYTIAYVLENISYDTYVLQS